MVFSYQALSQNPKINNWKASLNSSIEESSLATVCAVVEMKSYSV